MSRAKARIALVFPYVRSRAPTEMLFPPLGVATLAAQLNRVAITARVFDCTFSSLERLGDELVDYGPDVVGVSSVVSLTQNALLVAEMVREKLPHSLLVAGGPLPTVFPHRYGTHFDAVFRGEADLSFPRFCRDYLDGSGSPSRLSTLSLETYGGLFASRAGLRIDNPTVHHTEAELRSFPLPDRRQFDHVAYQQAWLEKIGSKVTSIITTLGCPFGCDFCSKPVFGSVLRRRPLQVVSAEIDQLRDLGYDSLWIADDTFTLDRSYLEEFCGRMASLGMSWSCLSRADGVDAATVRMMKEAGCRRVYLGLESGSQRTLELMNKQATVEEGIETIHRYREGGIEVGAFFIVGYPGETATSIEATFELALSLPLQEISFNVPYPLPGSTLFDRLGGPDDGRDWEGENEVTFVYPSEFDEAWLRRRIDETMRAFKAEIAPRLTDGSPRP